MYRVAFDPALPVVAAAPFTAGERSFAAGDAVDWQALGVTTQMLFDWWRVGLVVHPLPVETPQVESKLETFTVTPGESLDVRTPEQLAAARPSKKRQRAAQRASE